MSKIDLQPVASVSINESSFISTTNANYAEIENKSDTFLSRVGTTPNQMESDIDMNSNRILNLPAPASPNEPIRVQDITGDEEIAFTPIITSPEATVKGRGVGDGEGDTQDLTATELNEVIGTANLTRTQVGGSAEIFISSEGNSLFRARRASTGSGASGLKFQRSRGTIAAPTAPPAAVDIGSITFDAYDGVSAYPTTAQIKGQVASTTSPTNAEGRLIFGACPNTSITISEMCRMSHAEGLQSGINITRAATGATPALITITSEDTANVRIQRSSTGSAAPAITMKRSRGTVAAPTAIAQTVNLGEIAFQGYGTTGFQSAAAIRSTAIAATPSDTDMQSELAFDACPASSVTPSQMFRVNHTEGLVSSVPITTPGVIGTVQTLTGAGAVNLTTYITRVETTGSDALTLADGVEGQLKIICMTARVGDGTLTPTNLAAGTTITFNSVGDSVMLCFLGTDWHIVSNNGCAVA